MKSLFIIVASLFFVLFVSAAPINLKKRDVVYVTQYVTLTRTATRVNSVTSTAVPVYTVTAAPKDPNTYYRAAPTTTEQQPSNDYVTVTVTANQQPQDTYVSPTPSPQQPENSYVSVTSQQEPKQTQSPADDRQSSSGSASDSYGTISSSDAQNLLSLVNGLRSQKGIKSLKIDSGLTSAALSQSQYQASINSMTHDNSNFSGLIDRFAASGANCSGGCAENVAGDFGSVQSVFDAWVNSPGHLANILGGGYTSMGIAYYGGYWTQTFNGQ